MTRKFPKQCFGSVELVLRFYEDSKEQEETAPRALLKPFPPNNSSSTLSEYAPCMMRLEERRERGGGKNLKRIVARQEDRTLCDARCFGKNHSPSFAGQGNDTEWARIVLHQVLTIFGSTENFR